jgi:ABC-2 type transport system ATP-binding protein
MKRTPAARARGISKYYGDIVALDGVDLDVDEGQVHGLIGPNGAGKTTLLGLLLGVAIADAGTVEIFGRPVGRSLEVADGVAGFVDGPGLYPSLTARQNLTALAALRGTRAGRAAEVDDALEQAGLSEVADVRVRGFSLGMRQRLGLAAALLTRPRLLILDEPANGLDPAGKRHVHRVISGLADDGVAIVLSSHRMDDLALLCADVTILATGRVVFSGPIDKLAAESGELDYRVLTSDSARARAIATDTPGLRVHASRSRWPSPDALVVRGPACSLDALVVRLVGAGVAVRELAPVVAPLEAAFLALTGGDPDAEDTA